MKKYLKFFVIMCIISVLIFSNLFYVFGADHNAGGQNQTTATGKGSVDTRTEFQGYRFTFVETATGHKVGNTVDILT